MLSNGVSLLFYINVANDFEKGKIYKGLDFISLPLNLPMKTSFECKSIDDKYIELEGWINLNEENLDILLKNQSFINHAKEYHTSQDFQITSSIKVKLEKSTQKVLEGKYTSKIKGGNKLLEEVKFEVISAAYEFHNQIYKTYKGKSYTFTEWREFEKERDEIAQQKFILREEKQGKDSEYNFILAIILGLVSIIITFLLYVWIIRN